MVDARLPSHWLHDPAVEELSDHAWRVFTGMLMWSNEQGTDGVIPRRSLRLMHPDGVDGTTIQELIAAGLVEPQGDALAVTNWSHSQSMSADVEWQRERNRKKNRDARDRARDKATRDTDERAAQDSADRPVGDQSTEHRRRLRPGVVTGHASGHGPGHVTGQPGGEARTGQARTGPDREKPPVVIPAGGITPEHRDAIASSWRESA